MFVLIEAEGIEENNFANKPQLIREVPRVVLDGVEGGVPSNTVLERNAVPEVNESIGRRENSVYAIPVTYCSFSDFFWTTTANPMKNLGGILKSKKF